MFHHLSDTFIFFLFFIGSYSHLCPTICVTYFCYVSHFLLLSIIQFSTVSLYMFYHLSVCFLSVTLCVCYAGYSLLIFAELSCFVQICASVAPVTYFLFLLNIPVLFRSARLLRRLLTSYFFWTLLFRSDVDIIARTFILCSNETENCLNFFLLFQWKWICSNFPINLCVCYALLCSIYASVTRYFVQSRRLLCITFWFSSNFLICSNENENCLNFLILFKWKRSCSENLCVCWRWCLVKNTPSQRVGWRRKAIRL